MDELTQQREEQRGATERSITFPIHSFRVHKVQKINNVVAIILDGKSLPVGGFAEPWRLRPCRANIKTDR